MAATVLLPLAMPPVRPRRSMEVSSRTGDVRGGGGFGGFSGASAKAGGFHRVAHEHGDGHRPNAAGHGSERAGDIEGVGMHVAYERGAFSVKFFEAGREVVEEARGFG